MILDNFLLGMTVFILIAISGILATAAKQLLEENRDLRKRLGRDTQSNKIL